MLNLVIHSQFISSVWRTEVLKYCWRVTNRKPKYVIMPMILLLYSNNNCICILQYLPALYILIIFEKFLWSLLHLARILLSPCHRTWKSFFFSPASSKYSFIYINSIGFICWYSTTNMQWKIKDVINSKYILYPSPHCVSGCPFKCFLLSWD